MSNHPRKDVLEEKQCVILKGRRDGISILLDDKADFELIKNILRDRVAGSRNFFDGAKATVNFKGRKLTTQEEAVLLDIIQYEANLDVSQDAVQDTAPEAVSKKLPKHPRMIPSSPHGLLPDKSDTYYYRGGVRSGQAIRQNGSVVIIGDVNPGGEVKASGNIIILGALRGSAWAGAEGGKGRDKNCFISALEFNPTQLRIANLISMPDDAAQMSVTGRGAWAYIRDEAIFISKL